MTPNPSEARRELVVNDIAAVVTTDRFDDALAWYGCLFGREPDLHPVAGVAEWQRTATATKCHSSRS